MRRDEREGRDRDRKRGQGRGRRGTEGKGEREEALGLTALRVHWVHGWATQRRRTQKV